MLSLLLGTRRKFSRRHADEDANSWRNSKEQTNGHVEEHI
jgi:hypothetical protein